jgi:hypothetical protein
LNAVGNTTPSQFRLEKEVLKDLDRIAAHLEAMTGTPASRAAAIRYAVRQFVAATPDLPALPAPMPKRRK